MATYAVYGQILVEVLGSPTEFESTRPYTFATHNVVESRPLLQWLSKDLEELNITFLFHVRFTNPARQLQTLVAAADDHQARQLVFGNGVSRGYFVIKSINEVIQLQFDEGTPISIEVKLTLQEYAPSTKVNPNLPLAPSGPAIATTQVGRVIPTLQPLHQVFPPGANPPFLLPLVSPSTTGSIPGTYTPAAPSNTLSVSSIAALGGLPKTTYVPPSFVATGSSVLASPYPSSSPGPGSSPDSVSTSTITRGD